AVMTGVLFGLAPAFRASATDVNDALRAGARSLAGGSGAVRLRNSLVVLEVALALIALVGTGLFLRNLQQAQRIDPGFESRNLLLIGIDVGQQGYTPEHGQQFYREAIARAQATAGVTSAAV